MPDKLYFDSKLRATNDIKKLDDLARSVRIASNRNSIKVTDANKLVEQINKKKYMLQRVEDSKKRQQAKDAVYTIKKESGKEQYNVYVNDKMVKTFGSLVDAQRFVRDYKLGRV